MHRQQQQALCDYWIIRRPGSKRKKKHSGMEAHRQGDEKEEEQESLPAPGSRSHGMARQCPRGRSSCKSREDASVTPTSSMNSTAPGDDGTGATNAARAPGQSQEQASIDNEVHSSPETTNRQRRFTSRSGRVAIWRRRKHL
jgi:hypothetical protein